jgi:hypothetical protein
METKQNPRLPHCDCYLFAASPSVLLARLADRGPSTAFGATGVSSKSCEYFIRRQRQGGPCLFSTFITSKISTNCLCQSLLYPIYSFLRRVPSFQSSADLGTVLFLLILPDTVRERNHALDFLLSSMNRFGAENMVDK